MIPTFSRTPVAAAQVKDAEVSILGMDSQQSPRASLFPSKFNRSCFSIWERLFQDPIVLNTIKSKPSTNEAWMFVIQEFIRACSTEGLSPFATGAFNSNNDILKSFLLSSRIKVVQFYNESDFFAHCKIQSVVREYKFANGRLEIWMHANLRPNSMDPVLEQWLVKLPTPSFRRDASEPGLYKKSVAANVDLTVKFYNRLRVEVGYKIMCHSAPVIDGNMKKIPSKVQLARFTESNIWLPLVRAHRIAGVGLRIF